MQKEFDKVKPYVYWIKNNITGIKYIGVRWANVNKNKTPIQDLGKTYFSSGQLKKDFKNNPENFKIKLIATFDSEKEAQEYELKQTKKIIKNKRYANIAAYPAIIMTPEIINKLFTPEHRRKLSITSKGRKFSEETRRKLSATMKGRKLSEEHKRKLSQWQIGRKLPEETKRKLSEVFKGREMSEEWRRKLSAAAKGRKKSEETRRKMSIAQQNMSEETKKSISKTLKLRWATSRKGFKHSEETRRKMSETRKGRKRSSYKK